MAIEDLVGLVLHPKKEQWAKNHQRFLDGLFGGAGGRYPVQARNALKLRAPEDIDIPYAAYIHPDNPDSGAYGGTSLVFFPPKDSKDWPDRPCLIGMVVGTQGLSPDESILSRPGHARKVRAICSWLNQRNPGSAWAKQDPTRTDVGVPKEVCSRWPDLKPAFDRYNGEIYGLFRPPDDPAVARDAILAFLDLLLEERGFTVLKAAESDAARIRATWFQYLMPSLTEDEVLDLLRRRRFVILQGPPGTGKTHMAKKVLKEAYGGRGRVVQFHANTTYENFIGGLVPIQDEGALGLQFRPRPGYLMQEVAACDGQERLLVLDEINRADLAKVLGEAIYLLEAGDPDREVSLSLEFDALGGSTLRLPPELHVLGTMNTADRSIALVDVAVRRRFAFVSLWPSYQVVEQLGCERSKEFFRRTVSLFVEHATDDSMSLVPGHSYFLADSDDLAVKRLKFELVPLLEEYLAQGFVSGFAEDVRALIQDIQALQ